MDTFWGHIDTFKCPVCNETNLPLFGKICYKLCNHPDYAYSNKLQDYCDFQDFFPILTATTADFPLPSSPKNDETDSIDSLDSLNSLDSPDSPDSLDSLDSLDSPDSLDLPDSPLSFFGIDDDDDYLPPLPRIKSTVKRVFNPVKKAVNRVKNPVKSAKTKKNINFMKRFSDTKDSFKIKDDDDEIFHKTGYTKYQLVDMDLYETRKIFVYRSDLYNYVCTITRRYKNRVYARHSRSKKIRN